MVYGAHLITEIIIHSISEICFGIFVAIKSAIYDQKLI